MAAATSTTSTSSSSTITPLPHADAARFLRIDACNGEIHHVELYSESSMLSSTQQQRVQVHIMAAHDLGKVSNVHFVCVLFLLGGSIKATIY